MTRNCVFSQVLLNEVTKYMSVNSQFPPAVQRALQTVDESWLPSVIAGLTAMNAADPQYLPGLAEGHFLPSQDRLFAAFSIPLDDVKFVLVGEGPYPREESATGFCFMDGAVDELWSSELNGGLSKKVNRATSLRNFIKMLLVAEGRLDELHTSGTALAAVSALARGETSGFIHCLPELQNNMTSHGFLLLNATLVYRADVAPSKDARAWQAFLQEIFSALHLHHGANVSLVLWGKIAEQLKQIPATSCFSQIASEHPYNLSFITNKTMQKFFLPMHLLMKEN
jgi:uracil-DNA glycosylase